MDSRANVAIIIVSEIISTLFLFGLAYPRHGGGTGRGEKTWAFGTLVLTVGIVALAVQGFVSPWIGIVASNTMIVLGMMLLNVGMRQFLGRPLRSAFYGCLLALFFLSFIAFSFILPVLIYRLFIFSFTFAALSAELSFLWFETRVKFRGAMPSLVGSIMAFNAVFFLVRPFLTPLSTTSIFTLNMVNLWTFVIQDMEMVANSMGLILLQNHVLQAKLAESEEYNRILFADSPIPLLVLDPETTEFTDSNKAANGIYSVKSATDLMGKTPFDFAWPIQAGDIDSREAIKIHTARIVETGRDSFDWTNRRAGGERWYAHVEAARFQYAGKTLIQYSLEDITARKRAEEALQKAFAEKETLLRELQHRVKNSMSIIASLVSLEAGRSKSSHERETLQSLGNRIAALGSMYDMLFHTGKVEIIQLGAYLRMIVDTLVISFDCEGKGIAIRAAFDSLDIDVKSAISIGLILNELVTDSMKYAFSDGRPGVIDIELRREEGWIVLEVRDDGVGFPGGTVPPESRGMGMTIVEMLTNQLEGSLEISSASGARFRVRIPFLANLDTGTR
jgi:PAS domain S-box-containing protein